MKENRDFSLSFKEAIRFIKGYVKKRNVPSWAYLELTNSCNFKCVHCFIRPFPCKKEMSYKEICSVLDQLADLGVFFLVLTGGEPFTRRDFWDICNYARTRGFAIRLNTNASMITRQVARRIADIGIFECRVSVYGMSKYTYGISTNNSGSFKKAWNGIELLIKLWNSRELPGLLLAMMLFRHNFFELDDFMKFVKKTGVDYNIDWEYSPCRERAMIPFKYTLTQGQVEDLARKYPQCVAPLLRIKPTADLKLCSVGGGQNSIAINAFGQVVPCAAMQGGMTIREKPIKEIVRRFRLFDNLPKLAWRQAKKCRSCDAVRFCCPCAADFFLYTKKLVSNSPPLSMCKHKGGLIKKRIYEELTRLGYDIGAFKISCQSKD